jgi:hypothetical protein
LKSVQPLLDEIRGSNEKPFVKYPPDLATSPTVARSNFFLLGKLLIIQARYCESATRPDLAVEWFRHALIFAQRVCDENCGLVPKLISLQLEALALDQLEQFMMRQHLDEKTCLKIADFLTRLRETQTPFWQAMKNERPNLIRKYAEYFSDMVSAYRKGQLSHQQRQNIEPLIADNGRPPDALMQQYKKYLARREELLKRDCVEIMRSDFRSLETGLPLLANLPPIDYKEAARRECCLHAQWNLAITTAQICAYRAVRNRLPRQLAELRELQLSPPNDPFSGQPLKYVVEDNKATLYSLGPDTADDRARIPYDPTNGTISPGDVAYKL